MKIITVSGITGSGHTVFFGSLSIHLKGEIIVGTSAVTRKKEERDINSPKKYFHTNEQIFQKLIEKNALLENEKVHNDYYGTLLKSFNKAKKISKDLLLEIDLKGVLNLIKRKNAGEEIFKDVEIFPVFIYRRFSPLENFNKDIFKDFIFSILKKRNKNISEEVLNTRFKTALEEYLLVRENKNLLNLFENYENNPLLSLDEFDEIYFKD